jgi:hypothetical protein
MAKRYVIVSSTGLFYIRALGLHNYTVRIYMAEEFRA